MYNREKIIQVMKEIKSESDTVQPYVVIAQPRRSLDEPAAQTLDGWNGLHIDMLGYSHGFVCIDGEKVDVARNYLIEQCLESGAKYMLFIGDDTVMPYNGFLQLHEVAEKNPDAMVVGVYYLKLSSPMIMVRNGNHIIPADVTPGQVYEAWQTGLDAALIPISILKALRDEEPELPFCCIGNNLDGLPFIGEDNFFVYRLRKAGFKLLVNTDVQCLHIDLATGKYTAHPDIDLHNYFTNIPITGVLTMEDKLNIDKRWIETLPNEENSNAHGIEKPIKDLLIDYSEDTYKRVVTKMNQHKSTQNYYEVSRLCERIKALNPKTVLEIGVETGGSMKLWMEFADDNAHYIGIDINQEILKIKYANKNQRYSFIAGDSTKEVMLNKVREILGDTPVDFLFIDGGHDEESVRADYRLYSQLVKEGGIIAFHDINVSAEKIYCAGITKLWNEIKSKDKSAEEFINIEADLYFGIGMIVRED